MFGRFDNNNYHPYDEKMLSLPKIPKLQQNTLTTLEEKYMIQKKQLQKVANLSNLPNPSQEDLSHEKAREKAQESIRLLDSTEFSKQMDSYQFGVDNNSPKLYSHLNADIPFLDK